MATKPATIPTWGTDATLASGTQSGQTTRLAPSAGYRAQGMVPGRSVPGRIYNWLFGLYGEWITYLADLHGSADFLNKVYQWTNTHVFGNGIAVDGFVGIRNSGAGEVVYVDNLGGAELRTGRRKQIPLTPKDVAGAFFIPLTDGGLFCTDNQQSWNANFTLPDGCVLTAIRSIVRQSNASLVGTTIRLQAWHNTPDWNAGGGYAVPVSTALGDVSCVDNTTRQLLALTGLSATQNQSTYHVQITTSDNAGAMSGGDTIHALEVEFSDPGPRNT